MKNTIATIILGMFLISCISAINITAGDFYELELSKQYSYYTITNNLTAIDLNVSQNQTIVTILIGKYVNDNFTIIFYGEQDEVIGSSGGASGGSWWSYKEPDLNVTEEIEVEDTEVIEDIKDEIIEEEIIKEPNSVIPILILIGLIGFGILLYIIFKK